MTSSLPILYGFFRCPYVIRTRMTLAYSGINYILREVNLRNKPEEMLAITRSGTVPVMQLPDGRVIDNSLDIIYYALSIRDNDGWNDFSSTNQKKAQQIITRNDTEFAPLLQKYKYFERYPENTQIFYRQEIEKLFLTEMDEILESSGYLMSEKISIADIAIFPMIRQFAYSDEEWFFTSRYTNIIRWLEFFLKHPIFTQIMKKNTVWQSGAEDIILYNYTNFISITH